MNKQLQLIEEEYQLEQEEQVEPILNTDGKKERTKNPPVDQLQPLAWSIKDNFDLSTMGKVYGLKLPFDWIDLIKSLSTVDSTPPILGLYAALRGCAPDILYIFPNSFNWQEEKRPPYWLIVHENSNIIDLNFFWDVIREWLVANYSNDQELIRNILAKMEAARVELSWELINLKTAPFSIIKPVLPELIVRWLTRKGFQFQLSDSQGRVYSFPMIVSASTSSEDAYLVTWPPCNYSSDKNETLWKFSYYLRFWVTPPHGKTPALLLFQPGIRRYITHPMVKWDNQDNKPLPSAKSQILLPSKEDATVYAAVEELGWVKPSKHPSQPRETTLINFTLTRNNAGVSWKARIDTILSRVAPHLEVPQTMQFLTNPRDFAPQYLLSYSTRLGKHAVGAGVEAADRFELFERLTKELPSEIIPSPQINKIDFGNKNSLPHRKQRRLSKKSEPLNLSTSGSEILYRIAICSNESTSTFIKILLDFLTSKDIGGTVQAEDGQADTWQFTNREGEVYRLKIEKNPFPAEWYQPLDLKESYSNSAKSAATQNRARLIERDLAKQSQSSNERLGILIELPDYRKFEKKRRLADPKAAIRWGHALGGWVSQFIEPDQKEYVDPRQFIPSDPTNTKQVKAYEFKKKQLKSQIDSYKARCQNAVMDLLRQLDFPLGLSFHREIPSTSIPALLDIISIRILRVNARNKSEKKAVLPILIKVPATNSSSQMLVCLPGEHGPIWMPYRESLLMMAQFEQRFAFEYDSEKIMNFVRLAFKDLLLEYPTLLLLDEQNIRKDLPEILCTPESAYPTDVNNRWHQNLIFPNQNAHLLRVAKLRYSWDGTVPHVCPTAVFNRYSGIYQNSDFNSGFFSIGRDPQSAKTRTNTRQRDRILKASWNQTALEISWLSLQQEDQPEEWTLIVHNLRRCSPFIDDDIVTLLPQPLHAAQQLSPYIPRLTMTEEEEDDFVDEAMIYDEPEFIQLSLF
ncbi:pPIWI_RE module domain-containing protein [Nostoc sp. 2RC]|uniref:pPIWI_RE module domain-containing protein n=1 Tax=Nostoc sp. 2RC TaxID=2485484 RepID=UPI0016293AE7|nr:DUF3962 domain-containing protein [Nostoc sp. 2RC]MBC1237367.1 DUF3962 domain-containing protein [Nostoc sp. 2RC]